MTSPEKRIKDAIDLYYRNPEAGLTALRQITQTPISAAWAEAHVALARHELGQANYRDAIDHAKMVVDKATDAISPGLRGVAAILYCIARDGDGGPIDSTLLAASIETALAEGQYYDAADGLQLLAMHKLQENDGKGGRALLERAVPLYDQAGSMIGGPSTLERLTNLDIQEGKLDEARRHLALGLATLARFPLGGMNVRLIERRLLALRLKVLHE